MSLAYDYDVFKDTSAGWTALDLQLKFWAPAQAYALKRWARKIETDVYGGTWGETLRDCAEDAILEVTGFYHAWCAERGLNPDDRALFWKMIKQNIDWAVADAMKTQAKANVVYFEDLEATEDQPADDDLTRTQLYRHRPASLLHEEIVDVISTIPTREKLLLALRFFEELDWKTVTRLAGFKGANATNQMIRTTTRILRTSRNMVVNDPEEIADARRVTPLEVTSDLTRWLLEHYGTNDVHAYLGYVTRHYYADVSYVIDFIKTAHGVRVAAFGLRTNPLTREQMAELDARLLAGDTQIAIARDFDVPRALIAKIVQKGYR